MENMKEINFLTEQECQELKKGIAKKRIGVKLIE
jgi:hypothetical protein